MKILIWKMKVERTSAQTNMSCPLLVPVWISVEWNWWQKGLLVYCKYVRLGRFLSADALPEVSNIFFPVKRGLKRRVFLIQMKGLRIEDVVSCTDCKAKIVNIKEIGWWGMTTWQEMTIHPKNRGQHISTIGALHNMHFL